MNILAFETCFGFSSVCLYFNGEFIQKIDDTKNNHSNFLPLQTKELLMQADIEVKNIDAIIVNHGPGAFTGIRAGIAFAKGLAFANKILIYGISTMECFIKNELETETSVAVQGLKGHVYFQTFNKQGIAITEAKHIAIEDIPRTNSLITVGVNIENEMQHYEKMPHACNLIERFLFIQPELYNEPLYIRPVNAVISQNMKPIK